jgi:hypothetical protein
MLKQVSLVTALQAGEREAPWTPPKESGLWWYGDCRLGWHVILSCSTVDKPFVPFGLGFFPLKLAFIFSHTVRIHDSTVLRNFSTWNISVIYAGIGLSSIYWLSGLALDIGDTMTSKNWLLSLISSHSNGRIIITIATLSYVPGSWLYPSKNILSF